jgi:LytR_cpsA_psr family
MSKAFWRSMCFMCALIVVSILSARCMGPIPTFPRAAATAAAANGDVQTGQPQAEVAVSGDLFDEAIAPFITLANRGRTERNRADAFYAGRIDPELNEHRINFLLFGYGETNEPPLPRDIIGSITIMSLDYRSRSISQISLTHDARAPEIERFNRLRGEPSHPSKIDTTYRHGGFELMRLAVENATGLSIDYQLAAEDVLVKQLVDDVFGGIEIDNPVALATNPIYVSGRLQPCLAFPKGRQTLDGIRTLCYLKGLAYPPYDPAKENNLRKHIVFQGLKNEVDRNLNNPLFAIKMLALMQQQLEEKTIAYDFDAKSLIIGAVEQLAGGAGVRTVSMPTIDQNLYLVDDQIGDGGFTWVMGTQNPIIRDELKRGIYKDTAMVVTNGDPNAQDLAKGYWNSVRTIVKSKLMHTAEILLSLPSRPWSPGKSVRPRPY